jgi:hypothetical protein
MVRKINAGMCLLIDLKINEAICFLLYLNPSKKTQFFQYHYYEFSNV